MFNPGWGEICVNCKNVWEEADKYTNYPPDFPCKKVTGGGIGQRHFAGPDFRKENGQEVCSHYDPEIPGVLDKGRGERVRGIKGVG